MVWTICVPGVHCLMSIDLSPYRAIQVANFVRLDIPNYAVLRFSDFGETYTIAGETYSNIGSLLSVGDTYSEIRALDRSITVGLSGIPTGSVPAILNNNPRGGTIDIRQAFFDPTDQTLLDIPGNPALQFRGLVDNYAMTEEWDSEARTSTFTIVLNCTSLIATLQSKITGRRTNDKDQQRLYPGDISMSRVFAITRTNFQFGKTPTPKP